MSDIRKEIHESCDNFVRETGLSPTRIYIGGRKWDELRTECGHGLYPAVYYPFSVGKPTFDGLDIYLTSEPDHLHVTR